MYKSNTKINKTTHLSFTKLTDMTIKLKKTRNDG